jgi:hypothetical protein
MAVSSEDGKALGSKVVAYPEIGSEFEFDDFLVTIESARSPLDDITNHVDQPLHVTNHNIQPSSEAFNPSKIQKRLHQQTSQRDSQTDNSLGNDCNPKFLVAYTRYDSSANSIEYKIYTYMIALNLTREPI